MNSPKRNLEQVISILNLAKISETDVVNESHVLRFAPEIATSKEVKLIEVTKDTLKYIQSGESLFVKGGDNPTVVICSNSATFEMKEAETSNSLLLMPDLKDGAVIQESNGRLLKEQRVQGIFHTYLEMKPVKPRLGHLRRLLDRHSYKGKNKDGDGGCGLTFSQLKEQVQASESEILNRLEELPAVKIDGKWRLIDVALLYAWVTHLDGLLCQKELTVEEASVADLVEWMAAFEVEAVNTKCVAMFFKDRGDFCQWNQPAVSQLLALYLLPVLKAFDSRDFFVTWQQSMPKGVQVDELHLRGVAIVDNESTPPLVRYLPEFDLPEEIHERLEILFRTRPKWSLADITPYIQTLADQNLNVQALLTKFTRSSTVNGMKLYSSKY